jgi:hypothetical protein
VNRRGGPNSLGYALGAARFRAAGREEKGRAYHLLGACCWRRCRLRRTWVSGKAVAVAVAAPVVALREREGGRLGEHARGTNNPVGWPVQGVQQRRNCTGLLLDMGR